jgi:hypothetical protein
MGLMHRLTVALLLASFVAAPRLAAADDSNPYGRTPLTQKEKLRWNLTMRDGKKLVEGERWVEASAKFTEAIRLDPDPEAFLWKGFSEEKLGHLVVAKAIYLEAQKEAKTDNLPQALAQAEEALSEIGKKIPRIVLRIPTGVQATVIIDGATIVPPAEGADVDPGARSVDVTATGRRPFHTEVKAEEGQVYPFNVPLALLVDPSLLPPVEGSRGCGPCSIESSDEALLPGALAALAALLVTERRRSRRRRA